MNCTDLFSFYYSGQKRSLEICQGLRYSKMTKFLNNELCSLLINIKKMKNKKYDFNYSENISFNIRCKMYATAIKNY